MLIRLYNRINEFRVAAEVNVPAGTLAMVRSFLVLRSSTGLNALHTLIHQSHPMPSCGGPASTAERTMNPARTNEESLTMDPELENNQDPKEKLITLTSFAVFGCSAMEKLLSNGKLSNHPLH
jgi:hypothetical protein